MVRPSSLWGKGIARIAVGSLAAVFFLSSAYAGEFSGPDAEKARSVVEMQLQAFAENDQETAFSFAAPVIKDSFGSADAFMEMVKRGYGPVYRNNSHRFEESFIDKLGRPSLRMRLGVPDGAQFEAIYTMEMQPDGSWKISGCILLPVMDFGA